MKAGSRKSINSNSYIIGGIDDATKCPCIGSIFVAGVLADEKIIRKWKRAGVKDSKLITRKKREKLEKLIKETAVEFIVDDISPQRIDDKRINLNDWELFTVLRIIGSFKQLNGNSKIYIDNWEVNEELFRKRLEELPGKLPENIKKIFSFDPGILDSTELIVEHRADENYTIVGAASILAKCASDRQYDEYRKKYGDFGSGSPGDPKTRAFVWRHRRNPVPIIRTSWRTFKILSALEKLEDDKLIARLKSSTNVAG